MKPVVYRKPRIINPVSVTLVVLLLVGGYVGYECVRVEFQRQEAYRVLEETGSAYSGRHSLYLHDTKQREILRGKMQNQLISIGVNDPELETWIDAEPGRAQFGVVYTARYHWPFDVRPTIPRELQIQHDVTLPQ